MQNQFEGRARWGQTFGGHADQDGNGHGTHCAGTIGGKQYGVAKGVDIIAVKVLSDGGSGSVADVVSGMEWTLNAAKESGRPSVASMSLGGSPAQAIDDAAAALTASGVHLVVAAGNSNGDADGHSPARAPSAITVGASTITDSRASFSNYGAVVDIFAPGQDIISSWIGGPDATRRISGTSMATPHVSGLVAYLIAQHGNISPEEMSEKLKELALNDVLTGIPPETINNLAHFSVSSDDTLL
ncbi:hypothetical protein HGRIS_008978 [Hohenbuehelia grisea]|uniref:Peptidase S8/S53 domain-containing protein n=1 Tax=Hohenbuehelia grisea TaxID=104357 RepID=A0ABR3IZU2_9AGAR